MNAITRFLSVLAVSAALVTTTAAQSQSLPNGFLTTEANNITNLIVNQTANTRFHWVYDSAQFTTQAPILINQLSIRANANGNVAAFSFPQFDVRMASSLNNYGTATYSTTFANNFDMDLTLVRSGVWAGGPVPASASGVADWISIGMTTPFVYDPSLGKDLIIEIVRSGGGTLWGAGMDGQLGTGAGSVGGNRYGHTSNHLSATANFSNNEFVPVVKLDFVPVVPEPGLLLSVLLPMALAMRHRARGNR